jgi:hypothetical protein
MPTSDESLPAYIQAFKDFRNGRLQVQVHEMFPKPGGVLTRYQVTYLNVACMIASGLSGTARDAIGPAVSLIRVKRGADGIQSPLGYLLMGCFFSQFSYSFARPVLSEACRRYPKEKALWDCYAWDCESGEIPAGSAMDPRHGTFAFANAIEARKAMVKGWPEDDYNRLELSLDMDMMGEKAEAIRVVEEVIKRHPRMDETRKTAEGRLTYFRNGGFKAQKSR